MQRNLIILAGTLGVAILFLLCLWHAGPKIEADLTARSGEALSAAGLTTTGVTLNGRDARLAGSVTDGAAKDLAAEIVANVPGIRIVENSLTVGDAASPATAAVEPIPDESGMTAASQRIALRWSGEELVLTGNVPDASVRTDIVTAISATFGAARVRDELTLDPDVIDRATSEAGALATQLFRLIEGEATIIDGEVSLSGRAVSDARRSEVLNASQSRWTAVDTDIAVDAASTSAPVLTKSGCQEELNRLLAGERIRFAKNSADIETQSRGLLDRLTNVAQRCASARIEISGHTDSYGPAAWNTELSQLRADSVAGYLIQSGVAGNRLRAKGYGSEQPIADNETQQGREQNRRIEFKVLGDS